MILTFIEIEKQAKALLDAGHITKEQYDDRIDNAHGVMEVIKGVSDEQRTE